MSSICTNSSKKSCYNNSARDYYPPSPGSALPPNLLLSNPPVGPDDGLTPQSDILSGTVSGTPAYIENVGAMCKRYPDAATRIVNEHLTKAQVMKEHGLSDSTVVRIRRELRDYGLLEE